MFKDRKFHFRHLTFMIMILCLSCAKGNLDETEFQDNVNEKSTQISGTCDLSISGSEQSKFISDFKNHGIKIFGVSHILTDPCGIDPVTGNKLFPSNWQLVQGKEYCLAGKKAQALHNVIEGVMRNQGDLDNFDTNTYEYKISEPNYGSFLGAFGNQISQYTREFYIGKIDADEKSKIQVYLDDYLLSQNEFQLRNSKERSSVFISDESILLGKTRIKIIYDPYNQIEGDYVRDSDYIIKLPIVIYLKEKIEVSIDGKVIDSGSFSIDNSIPAIILNKEKIKLEIGTKVQVKYVG